MYPVQGKQLLCEVIVLDALVPSRLSAGSVGNPGIAAAEAVERKKDKYKGVIEKVYLFQPLAFEIQGSPGPSREEFLKDLCKSLCIMNNDPRAGSFAKHRISLAIRIALAACVFVTANDKMTIDEIFYL